jgi:hypothetical protein
VAYKKRGYLYRSRREGQRVKTEYLGKGEDAELWTLLDAVSVEEQAAEREAWRAERVAAEVADSTLDELGQLVRVAVSASLLAAGYHGHRRQWRKRRCRMKFQS